MARWPISLKVKRNSVAAFFWLALLAAARAGGAVVPAGTELELRLMSGVSSTASKPGDAVDAKVVSAVVIGGEFAIPAGSPVRGRVVEAKASPSSGGRAELLLEFSELRLGGGAVRIQGTVAAVDNARETVDEKGRILGIVAGQTISARLEAGIGKVGERNAALADVLGAAKGVLMGDADGEILYEPGTELTFRLARPITVTPPEGGAPQLDPIPDEPALLALAGRQPFLTMAQSPRAPSDIVNLMFVGTEEAIRSAFAKAGWTTAAELSPESALETLRAIAELRGYKEAPVSVLLLDGKTPDLVFQKQLNTFAMRHHLRIWRRPGAYRGMPIWAASATHDTGIAFSPENSTFYHTIDPRIDRERGKVANDLLLTGQVRALALVDRPHVPQRTRNATGDEVHTDGRKAVLILK